MITNLSWTRLQVDPVLGRFDTSDEARRIHMALERDGGQLSGNVTQNVLKDLPRHGENPDVTRRGRVILATE